MTGTPPYKGRILSHELVYCNGICWKFSRLGKSIGFYLENKPLRFSHSSIGKSGAGISGVLDIEVSGWLWFSSPPGNSYESKRKVIENHVLQSFETELAGSLHRV